MIDIYTFNEIFLLNIILFNNYSNCMVLMRENYSEGIDFFN